MLAPKAPLTISLLAEIALGQGNIENAEKYFQEILGLDKRNIVAIHGMARLSGLKGKEEQVEYWLREAVQQGAQDWRNHHNLGRYLQTHQKYDDAEQSLKKALSIAPPNTVEPRMVLCELYLEQQQATRALLEIERVIAIKATAKAWFLRGRSHFDLKLWQEAEDDFRRATLVDPMFHDARGAIGSVRLAMGDLDGAAQAFRSTLHFDPNNRAAQQNLMLIEQERAKTGSPK